MPVSAAALLSAWLLAAQTSPEKPPGYAGSAACQACHEDILNAFQKNAHVSLDRDKKRGWEEKACESCHGPGAKHAETASAEEIRNPRKLRPAETDRACLRCHLNQPTHTGRIQSSHAKNQVSCAACHSVHQNREALLPQRASAINTQCSGCHLSVWAEFQRPHKHRLPEGAMSCVDCHNPHGSLLPRSIQTVAGNDRGCFRCHGDKRGPFVFEHAPVKLEGCIACHAPHGSANPRMLNRQEVRFTCLECHANTATAAVANPAGTLGGVPPAFHDLRSPRFRNCTVCHIKVHGSYVNRALLR